MYLIVGGQVGGRIGRVAAAVASVFRRRMRLGHSRFRTLRAVIGHVSAERRDGAEADSARLARMIQSGCAENNKTLTENESSLNESSGALPAALVAAMSGGETWLPEECATIGWPINDPVIHNDLRLVEFNSI